MKSREGKSEIAPIRTLLLKQDARVVTRDLLNYDRVAVVRHSDHAHVCSNPVLAY